MKLTRRQQVILARIRDNGELTRQEAFKDPEIIRGIYPHPKAIARYVDQSLHRMVKNGMIVRESPGHYVLAPGVKVGAVNVQEDPDQGKLF